MSINLTEVSEKMNSYVVPGVRSLYVVETENVPMGAMLQSICGNLVAVSAPAERIATVGAVTLRWEGTKLNGCRQEKATLEFRTTRPLADREGLSFVAACASGDMYLLGTREGRRPVVTYAADAGTPEGGASAYSYRVTLVAQKAVLPCVL